MQVLITGAHGTVGTAITEHLGDGYDLTFLDRRNAEGPGHPHAERETHVADVADSDAIRSAFTEQDAVVHLAAYTRTDGSFGEVLHNNVVGTHNALEAAAEAGVETFVFASSNHVVGMYEQENAPGIYYDANITVGADAPMRPDSEYGASKGVGEVWGRMFAEQYDLRVYVIRFGSIRDPRYDHPYGDAEHGVDEGRWERGSAEYEEQVARMKGTWQSRRDCGRLVERCLRDDSVRFDVFYGVSDNERTWFDVDHAKRVLGYDPRDHAEEWTAPPESPPSASGKGR